MCRLLSNLLGIASAVAGVATFLFLYLSQARSFGASLVWTIMVGGSLFALSAYLDRRDARWYGRPPTRLLPTRKSLVNFGFICGLLAWMGLLLAIIGTGVLLMPAGDSWQLAWLRLLCFAFALMLGWLFAYAACFITQKYLRNYIYLDWADSIGPAMGPTKTIFRLLDSVTWSDLVIMAAVAIFFLLDGLTWLASLLPEELGESQSGRSRRALMRIHWLADHPHTIRLFAGAFVVCIASAWTVKRQCADRTS